MSRAQALQDPPPPPCALPSAACHSGWQPGSCPTALSTAGSPHPMPPAVSVQSGPAHVILQAVSAILKPPKPYEIVFNPFPKHDLGAFDIICYPPDFLVLGGSFPGLPSRCSCVCQTGAWGSPPSGESVGMGWQLRTSTKSLIFDV